MKLYLNDPKDCLTLSTEDGEVTLQTNMGIIAQPNGNDVKFISLFFPADQAYLAHGYYDDTMGIMILPEGLTPEHFGWEGHEAIKLSALMTKFKDDIT